MLGILYDNRLLLRYDNVGYSNSHACNARIMIAEVLDVIYDNSRLCCAEMIEAVRNELTQLLLVHADTEAPLACLLIAIEISYLRRQDLIEYHAAERGLDETIFADPGLYLSLQCQLMLLVHQESFVYAGDDLALTDSSWTQYRKVIGAQHHILCRDYDRLAILWCKDMICCKHQNARLSLCLYRKRQMDCHLVTVEVCVVRGAGQRMKLQCTTLCKDRLKRLNAQTMQRRCAV